MKDQHVPVLLSESLDYLVTEEAGYYFDGTLGFGGHSGEILKRMGSDGLLISTDIDKTAFNYCKKKFGSEGRVKLYNFNFSLIDVIAKLESIKFFNGVFADLGVSSYQLDDPSAGFSYSTDAPLDLRMDKNLKVNASDIVNTLDEKKLSNIIYKYGEEKNFRKIAKQIVEARKSKEIKTTGALKKSITEITSPRYQTKTLSRVFQALRIHVNNELEFLKQFLNNGIDVLKSGGRLVVISYHSLEDRIVKEFFKYGALSCICPADAPVCTCEKVQQLKILTKKPVLPLEEEIKKNKRARSAKLRVAERI
jgi:16S rRNA (cytosine1402-N4)-methyltransferase